MQEKRLIVIAQTCCYAKEDISTARACDEPGEEPGFNTGGHSGSPHPLEQLLEPGEICSIRIGSLHSLSRAETLCIDAGILQMHQ